MVQYWNPFLETLSREELDKIEWKNFKKYLAYACRNSTLYKEKFTGIDIADIRKKVDLRFLPLTDKEDLREAQLKKEVSIFGDILGVEPADIVVFRQTSGTTGQPVYVPETLESWQWRIEVWCHILWMAGFREKDRVFIPFGYNVYVAFWEAHYAAEKLGCLVVPGGALDTKGRINKMLEIGATALLCTPTYGLHMAEEAEKMGIDPKVIGIRRMVCAGEPLPEATRKALEDTWGAEVYNHIGGTEPCGWAAMCGERKHLHIMEPFFLAEILDVDTLSREVEEGELGIAVITPLGRYSFPLIRFNTQDIVRKGGNRCACGRNSTLIVEVLGRQDDLRKIRGVLFTPVAVEELIRGEFPQIGEYEIIVKKSGVMDEITLKAELRESVGHDLSKEVLWRLSERLKIKTNLRFNIKVVSPGALPRYTLKSKRFKDLR